MTSPRYAFRSPEVQTSIRALSAAVLVCQEWRRTTAAEALLKPDRSPVTVADFAVQAVVARTIAETFPADSLVAEEDAAVLRGASGSAECAGVTALVRTLVPQATAGQVIDWIDRGGAAPAGRFWTLDPIDGTKGLLRGDQHATALALIEDGEVVVGGLGCPRLIVEPGRVGVLDRRDEASDAGSVLIAVKGGGCWARSDASPGFVRIHVSPTGDPSRAALLRSYEGSHIDVDAVERVVGSLGLGREPILMDSQAKYALLAAGAGDLLLRLPSSPHFRDLIWDQAAGALIVSEAGGAVTDVAGRALDFGAGRRLDRNFGVIASNGHLHAAAVEACAKVLRASGRGF